MLTILNLGAWAVAAVLALWMAWDMFKTNRAYGEDYLTSSAEGDIIDAEMAETAARN